LHSPIDLEAYRRDGFAVGRFPLFPEPMLADLDTIAEEYRREAARGLRPADFNVPHFRDPRLFAWLMSEPVLDLVEPILGPDIALWTSQFFLKEAGAGKAIGWHSDGRYWEGYLDPVDVVSLWVALDRSDAGNGCLHVVPGSHRRRDYRYVPREDDSDPFFPVAVDPGEIDPAAAVPIELDRGEFVMFDAWLVHGSEANRSERPRRGFTMRYMPTSSRFHPVGRSGAAGLAKRVLAPVVGAVRGRPVYTHRIYLARGTDRAGNRYGAWPGEASVRRTPSASDTRGA
jgi:hypothetical protein